MILDNSRNVLNTNSKITLTNFASGGCETFVIKSVVGLGGSSVCYRALRGKTKGLLKEFYPYDCTGSSNKLSRDRHNQLIAHPDYLSRFAEIKNDFLESIHLLSKITFKNGTDILNNYIPSFEIFKGTSDDATVYVWCKENAGDTFADYISHVWKNPSKDMQIKLYNILATIKTISVSIVAMHKNGLLHRDIKPDNFLLFKDGLGNINPNNISLFDINSFSYGSRSKLIVGTPGYMAPEVEKGKASYYSDIYSIGAMLFFAITGKLYSHEYYESLSVFTEESKLLSTNDVYLKTRIVSILQKTLSYKPYMRYEKTEDLVANLDKAIVRLLPYTESTKLDSNQKIKIIEESKPIDAIPVFQNLFYKMPAYKWFDEKNDHINVLVVGGGLYAQAFMDVALQTLQIKDKSLHVTVATDQPDYDKQIYLRYRPHLERFFDIDKKDSDRDPTSYGSIDYIRGLFHSEASVDKDLIAYIVQRTNPCYVLVSLGDDAINYSVAKKIKSTKINACISFVCKDDKKHYTGVNPVYISRHTSYKDIDANLNRMAFNTHLVWNDSSNADIDKLYNEFRHTYNLKASMAFALSIPYKLYSLGMTMEDMSTVNKKSDIMACDHPFMRELSYAEHKRWTTEKLTNGWMAPLDSNGAPDTAACLRFNGDKSVKEKLHLCIVKGTSQEILKDVSDQSRIDEISDPLDKMNVQVYSHFKKAAKEYKKEFFTKTRGIFSKIRKNISLDCTNTVRLLNEYEIAVNAIINENDRVYSSKFSSMNTRLYNAIKESDISSKESILNSLEILSEKIQPAIYISKKINYKALDDLLIQNIPYIISNRPKPKLATTFVVSDCTNDIFKNVASATLTEPKHVKYFYYLTDKTDYKKLSDTARGVIRYLAQRFPKCTVEFVFASEGNISENIITDSDDTFYQKNIRIRCIESVSPTQSADRFAAECSRDYIVDLSCLPFDDAASNKAYIEAMKYINHFEFDSSKMEFFNIYRCEYLRNINTSRKKLNIDDLFILQNAECTYDAPDMFELSEGIRNIYSSSANSLKTLSKKLEEYSKCHDVVTTFDINTDLHSDTFSRLERILPLECYDGALYLIEKLSECGIILSGHGEILNSDSFRIDITFDKVYDSIPDLFSQYDILAKRLTTSRESHSIAIYCDKLYVKDICVNAGEYLCLKKLNEGQFINNLCLINEDPLTLDTQEYHVRFLYASSKIKRLLATKSAILQMHTYYNITREHSLDDIKTNVNVKCDNKTYHFDIVLTKGMHTVFIDCGTNDLSDVNERKKLNDIFGINGMYYTIE